MRFRGKKAKRPHSKYSLCRASGLTNNLILQHKFFLLRVNQFNEVAKTPIEEWMKYLKDGAIKEGTTVVTTMGVMDVSCLCHKGNRCKDARCFRPRSGV